MSEPRTPTGMADHDIAWTAADAGDIDGIASHAGLREGCPACFGIAKIEAEAAALERRRLRALVAPHLNAVIWYAIKPGPDGKQESMSIADLLAEPEGAER